MPVTITKKAPMTEIEQALSKLGAPSQTLFGLHEMGFVLHADDTGLWVQTKPEWATTVAVPDLYLGAKAMEILLNPAVSLGGAFKNEYRPKVLQWIAELSLLPMKKKKLGALDMLPKTPYVPGDTGEQTEEELIAAIVVETPDEPIVEYVKPKEQSPAKEKPASLQVEAAWPEFEGDIETAETKKLKYANRLYQPVRGTSASSRYFVVAANEEIKIAARWSGINLSVRIEGPQLDKYLARIHDVGFDKANGDYASVHLHTPNDMLAAKALGAILLGLGAPYRTAFPDIMKIKSKGM